MINFNIIEQLDQAINRADEILQRENPTNGNELAMWANLTTRTLTTEGYDINVISNAIDTTLWRVP